MRIALLVSLLAAAAAHGMERNDFSVAVSSSGEFVVVDVMTADASKYPYIKSARACTAVDLNMDPNGLCSTPGFTLHEVLPTPEDDRFEGHLWTKSRLVMRARTVLQDWPLVYLELTVGLRNADATLVDNGELVNLVTRVSREVRKEAIAVEKGRTPVIDVVAPISEGRPERTKTNQYRLAFLGGAFLVMVAAVFLMLVAKRKFNPMWRRIRTNSSPSYAPKHTQLLLGSDADAQRVNLWDLLTDRKRESMYERGQREKREQLEADERLGVSAGLITPEVVVGKMD